jgi:hypothetical protein
MFTSTLECEAKVGKKEELRERNQQIVKMTRPLITGSRVVEDFTVEITTSREIAASRAA